MMTAELQNWSVLATRAMNDAIVTIEMIYTEDTTEEEMIGKLRSRLLELVIQGFVLNGATTRKKFEEIFPMGKAKK